MAASSAAESPATSPLCKARTMSPKTCTAHMATLRVDMGTSARSCVIEAKNRLSAAAAIAVQMSPSTIAGIFGVKGVQIGVGFPFLKQQLHLPSPFIGPADHLDGISFGWQVGQEIAEALRLRVPADHEPQTQGASIELPAHPQLDPLTFGQLSVDGLERLVAQRAQAFAVFAKCLDDLRIHPRFGPDEKEAALILDAAHIMQVDIATISQQQTPFERLRLRQKGLFTGRIRREDHSGGGITEQVHGGMEFDRRRL